MKIFAVVGLLLAFTFAASAQNREPIVYQIKQVYQNADFDEKAIERFRKNIELRSEFDEIIKLFKPVKGKYRVILFMATGYGWLDGPERNDIIHNVLILKINKNNEILDGLEYVLEWAEPPFTARFVRAMKKGIKLKKGLQISDLDFRTFETDLQQTFNFGDINGVIDNLFNFKEVF